MAVEFALLFPLLFFLLFGTLIFGWRIWEHQAGQSTARDAARLASLGVPTDLTAYRHDVVCFGERNGLKPGTLTSLRLDYFTDPAMLTPGPAANGGYVQVSLTYRSALGAMPLVSGSDGTFTSAGLYRVEQVGTASGPQTVSISGERCQ